VEHTLWRELVDQRTLVLVIAVLVLVGAAQGRVRTRMHVGLVIAHVIAIGGAVIAATGGYEPEAYEVAALSFGLFAWIAIASTLSFRLVLPRIGIQLPRILIDILTAVAVGVALIVIGQRLGFSVTGLITTSAVLTAVLGFALQDTLGNIMGGIALQLDRSINIGDWVVLAPGMQPGKVIEIRWRYTALETTSWSTFIVPNSVLMKGQVTVLARRVGQAPVGRREIDFQVDYRTPPQSVIDPVIAAIQQNPPPHLMTDPAVQCLFAGVRDSVNGYRVRYWLDDFNFDETTDSVVRTRIYYALQRAGLEFSIPAQALFIATDDDARSRRHADREETRRLAAMARVDLLAVLEPDEKKRVAAGLHFAPFHRGESMTREGEIDDGLYMIVEGTASVQIGTGEGSIEVARLGPGQFFGEMSLMTGEKRSASVIATTDMITYRLDKPGFEALVRSRPPRRSPSSSPNARSGSSRRAARSTRARARASAAPPSRTSSRASAGSSI
jgi:small-conductance mechanosensitive channel